MCKSFFSYKLLSNTKGAFRCRTEGSLGVKKSVIFVCTQKSGGSIAKHTEAVLKMKCRKLLAPPKELSERTHNRTFFYVCCGKSKTTLCRTLSARMGILSRITNSYRPYPNSRMNCKRRRSFSVMGNGSFFCIVFPPYQQVYRS